MESDRKGAEPPPLNLQLCGEGEKRTPTPPLPPRKSEKKRSGSDGGGGGSHSLHVTSLLHFLCFPLPLSPSREHLQAPVRSDRSARPNQDVQLFKVMDFSKTRPAGLWRTGRTGRGGGF